MFDISGNYPFKNGAGKCWINELMLMIKNTDCTHKYDDKVYIYVLYECMYSISLFIILHVNLQTWYRMNIKLANEPMKTTSGWVMHDRDRDHWKVR